MKTYYFKYEFFKKILLVYSEIYGTIPTCVMHYFPDQVMHTMSYVTLSLRRRLSRINKDQHMSHLRNVSIERKMEVVKGCRRLRDYDTNPTTS